MCCTGFLAVELSTILGGGSALPREVAEDALCACMVRLCPRGVAMAEEANVIAVVASDVLAFASGEGGPHSSLISNGPPSSAAGKGNE